jgi:excisionase family DNA binding protein
MADDVCLEPDKLRKDSMLNSPSSPVNATGPNSSNEAEDRRTGRADDASKLDINNLPDLLTVREVADLLRVSPLTIKRWGKRGKLPAIRINSRGDRRYKKESVLWMLGVTQGEE